jgi:curved DNA-binding protein CbpA
MKKTLTLDMSGDTYYAVLGVPETATQVEIKRAYRGLIKRAHPDKHPDASAYRKLAVEQESRRIIEAYYVLSGSTQRSAYDQQLAWYRLRHAHPSPPPWQPQADTASASRSYTSPTSPPSQPRADHRRPSWAFWEGALQFGEFWGGTLLVFALLLILFSGNAALLFPSLLAIPDEPEWGSPDQVTTYCKAHPTSRFGPPGTPWEGNCSDWLRQHQSRFEDESLKPGM